jgi:hypothetical protein
VVALLCGVLGLGIGAGIAYLGQPAASHAGTATPVPGVSPSLPIDESPTRPPTSPDIAYPALEPGLPLNQVHTIGNDLATWTYHVPQGWVPYAVCGPGECRPPLQTDDPLTPRQTERQPEVRYRPADEPHVGGYSLRVKILDNTLGLNPGQMVGTKIRGFRQAYQHFTLLRQTPSAAYFTYIDGNDHLRFNYFQWFAAPGSTSATLEMSVAGREVDVPGLKALFRRFADNATGTTEPYHPGRPGQRPARAG